MWDQEDYRKRLLEMHREMRMVQLFRCSLCNGDYVSKEGLWNHLDLHEIADECKEMNYQKTKAARMHQCVLCNDQRAYSESLYRKHVHDVHDGFFLRCSDCGENFRSKQHKNDHASSRCKARVQAVASTLNAVQKKQVPTIEVVSLTSDAKHLKLLRGEQSSNAIGKHENRLRTDYANNNKIRKEPKLPTIDLANSNGLPPRFACEICGATFSSFGILLRHKRSKYACSQGSQQKCPHCRRVFKMKEYQAHFSLCEKKQFSCELCPAKFETSESLKNHMNNVHRGKGVLKNEKQDQNHVKNVLSKTINLVVEGRDINPPDKDIADESVQLLFGTPSSSFCGTKFEISESLKNHMNNVHRGKGVLKNEKQDQNHVKNVLSKTINLVVEGRDINPPDKDIADESVQLLFGTPSSSFCGTKCVHCDKEFASSSYLHQHNIDCHQPAMCNICGSIFQGYSNALHHKIMKHSEPKYECDRCSMEFHCIQLYERHSNDCDPVRSDSSHKNSGELVPKDRSDPNDSQVIDMESPVLSVAPSNGSSERQVVSEKTSESIVEKLSNHPYLCDICGITLSSYSQISFHKLTRHAEGTYQCPHCSRKFHFKYRLEDHVLFCAGLKHSCELCGQKFILQSSVEDHKKRVHHGSRPLRNANTEDTDCTEKQKRNSVEKIDAAQEMTSCIICRITFASTDELMKHKLSCPKDGKGPDDPQFGAREISLLLDVKGTQTNSTIVPQDENIDLKLEFEVEVTMLQEQEHQVPNEDPRRSFATTLIMKHSEPKYECDKCSMEFHCIKLYERHSKDCNPARSDSSHKNSGELVSKDRNYPNDSQVIDKESPVLSVAPLNGSSERQVVSEKTSESIVEKLSNHPYSCDICGITLSSYFQISFHKLTRHAEGTYQCPHCSRKFHVKDRLEDHVLFCADLKHPCKLCGQKFILQSSVEDHKKRFHHGSRPSRNANTEDTDCTEKQKRNSVEKIDAAQEMTSCIICRITFASTDELMKHKLSCPKDAKGPDDSQFSARETSLLHGVKGTQTDSTIVPQDENIDLKLEIEVEETMLQEQEHQVPNEDPRRSFATTLVSARQLKVSQLSCPKDAKGPDDSQFSTRDTSLLHGVKGTQTDSTIVPQDENIDLKLEIEVEETMLQEQEHQVPNEDPRKSFATTLLSCPKDGKDPDDSQFGSREISLLLGVKGTQTDSTIVPQDQNIDLKLEIEVKETMLQEQEQQVPNEDPRRSFATTLVSAQQLKVSQLSCPKQAKEHENSQFGTEEISLLHDARGTRTDLTTVSQGEDIDLNLEIKVEETMLQEQEYQVPNEDPGGSSDTALIRIGRVPTMTHQEQQRISKHLNHFQGGQQQLRPERRDSASSEEFNGFSEDEIRRGRKLKYVDENSTSANEILTDLTTRRSRRLRKARIDEDFLY